MSRTAAYVLPLLTAPPSARPPKLPPPQPVPQLRARFTEQLRALWAASTLSGYRSLWRRFTAWAARERLSPLDDESAALFLVAMPDVSQQSRLKYARTLRALFRRFGLPTQHLELLASALTASGAARPLKQARPMSPEQLVQALRLFPPAERDALEVAWASAARWDDMRKLRLSDVLSATAAEVILHFAATKANRAEDVRPQDLVVICGPRLPAARRLIAAMEARHAQLCRQKRLVGKAATKARESIAATLLSTRAAAKLLRPLGLSAHSIKRGAMTRLTELAAQRKLPLRLLGVMARHADTVPLPKSTVRYLGNPPALARAVGTARATRLL